MTPFKWTILECLSIIFYLLFMFISPGKTLAPWMLALKQESYLSCVKKVIEKISQTADPSHSSLDVIIFLLLKIKYIIIRNGYFHNLKTHQLQSKRELYYTKFILCVTLLMSNTLNKQLAVTSLDSFSEGGLRFYFLCPWYVWLRKQIHPFCWGWLYQYPI